MAKKASKKTSKPRAEARSSMRPSVQASAPETASARIDARIHALADWRGETLARMRRLIRAADPKVVEEWKWSVPVWSHDGILCTGETYKQVVKLTFAQGASLDDPARLFNSSLEGNVRRAIDLHEGDAIDEKAFKALVRAAVAHNSGSARAPGAAARKRPSAPARGARRAAEPKLLSGGNPQIPKGEGDGPVKDYISATPGWKRAIVRRVDALVERTVPDVRKAVKWNSPFYGVEGQGWFLSLHGFTKYVKLAFFRGSALRPQPPGESKQADVRYLDIHELDDVDEAQLVSWIRQAAALPGWKG